MRRFPLGAFAIAAILAACSGAPPEQERRTAPTLEVRLVDVPRVDPYDPDQGPDDAYNALCLIDDSTFFVTTAGRLGRATWGEAAVTPLADVPFAGLAYDNSCHANRRPGVISLGSEGHARLVDENGRSLASTDDPVLDNGEWVSLAGDESGGVVRAAVLDDAIYVGRAGSTDTGPNVTVFDVPAPAPEYGYDRLRARHGYLVGSSYAVIDVWRFDSGDHQLRFDCSCDDVDVAVTADRVVAAYQNEAGVHVRELLPRGVEMALALPDGVDPASVHGVTVGRGGEYVLAVAQDRVIVWSGSGRAVRQVGGFASGVMSNDVTDSPYAVVEFGNGQTTDWYLVKVVPGDKPLLPMSGESTSP